MERRISRAPKFHHPICFSKFGANLETILLRVFLTKVVSMASCEQSFSKLKLIKKVSTLNYD